MNYKEKVNVETCKAAFSFFINEFNNKIKTSQNTLDLTLAIRGYGYFAAPAVELSSVENVNQMFVEMIYKSEQVFFSASPETVEDKLWNLPSFVDTLAVMIHDGRLGIQDVFQYSLQRLCVLLMEAFPRLSPNQHSYACQGIVIMFLVVSRSSVSAKELLSDISKCFLIFYYCRISIESTTF